MVNNTVKPGLPRLNEVKAGYKETEVGIIPDDWDVKNISEITSLMTNGFVGVVKSQYTELDDGVLYIQGYNVEENSFNFHGIKKVTNEFHKQHLKSCLQEGDLLTIQTGDIGITTIVPKELVDTNCHALIITRFQKGKAEPKYFSYYFNSFEGKKRFKEIETGSTMKHINVGDMIQLIIPYPPITEQTAIAQALSDTDELISSLEKLITKKRNLKQGTMQQLLTGKKHLPGFSGKWVKTKIEKVTKFHKQGYYTKEQYKVDGKYYLLRGTDMLNPKIDLTTTPKINANQNDFNNYKVENEDVLIVRSGSIGRYGIVSNALDSIFGSYLICSDSTKIN